MFVAVGLQNPRYYVTKEIAPRRGAREARYSTKSRINKMWNNALREHPSGVRLILYAYQRWNSALREFQPLATNITPLRGVFYAGMSVCEML